MAARIASSACSSGVIDIVCGTLQAKLFSYQGLTIRLQSLHSVWVPPSFTVVIFNVRRERLLLVIGRTQFVIWTSPSLVFLKVSPLQIVAKR